MKNKQTKKQKKIESQQLVDGFKTGGCVVAFLWICFLLSNQFFDQKSSNDKFFEKPILHHCPYFISASVFLILTLFCIVFLLFFFMFSEKEKN